MGKKNPATGAGQFFEVLSEVKLSGDFIMVCKGASWMIGFCFSMDRMVSGILTGFYGSWIRFFSGGRLFRYRMRFHWISGRFSKDDR